MEEMGFEPMTFCMRSRHSTTELHSFDELSTFLRGFARILLIALVREGIFKTVITMGRKKVT